MKSPALLKPLSVFLFLALVIPASVFSPTPALAQVSGKVETPAREVAVVSLDAGAVAISVIAAAAFTSCTPAEGFGPENFLQDQPILDLNRLPASCAMLEVAKTSSAKPISVSVSQPRHYSVKVKASRLPAISLSQSEPASEESSVVAVPAPVAFGAPEEAIGASIVQKKAAPLALTRRAPDIHKLSVMRC